MRTKLYYSPDEITEYLYTTGSEWMLETDYTEYFGFYHTYTSGDAFTLGTYDSTLSKKLIPYEDMTATELVYSKLKPGQQTRYKTNIISYTPIPTNDEVRKGFLIRYFAQKHNETSIIEISSQQFLDIIQRIEDPNMYRTTSIIWYITGDLTTSINGSVQTLSVQQRNQQQIEFAKQNISNIHTKLTDLTELYTDTTYIVPADIN